MVYINTKNKLIIKYNTESAYIFAIIGFIFMKAFNTCIDRIFGDIFIVTPLLKISQIILLIPVYLSLLKRPKFFVLTEFCMLMVYFSGFVNADNKITIRAAIYGCCVYIPLAFAVYYIKDKEKLMTSLYRVAWITAPISMISFYVMSLNNGYYDMAIGYLLLLPTLCFFLNFLQYFQIKDFIIGMLSTLFILIYGSRGPIFCIGIFFLLSIIYLRTIKPRHKVYIALVGIGFAIMSFTFFNQLTTTFYHFIATSLHLKSRSLLLFASGEATNSSGRNLILDYYISKIEQSPIIGYGAFGAWPSSGTYPHNIVVELMVSFGIPIGLCLLMLFLYLILKGLSAKDEGTRRLIILFSSIAMRLLFSGSFLTEWNTYVLVALCLSALHLNKYFYQNTSFQ